jgi:hypothetical protein
MATGRIFESGRAVADFDSRSLGQWTDDGGLFLHSTASLLALYIRRRLTSSALAVTFSAAKKNTHTYRSVIGEC